MGLGRHEAAGLVEVLGGVAGASSSDAVTGVVGGSEEDVMAGSEACRDAAGT